MVVVMIGVCDWRWHRDFLLGLTLIHCYYSPKAMGTKVFRMNLSLVGNRTVL